MSFMIIDEHQVFDLLDHRDCIALLRQAMVDLSRGAVQMPLRQILPVPGGVFGIMPGAMAGSFGAKLLSVMPGNRAAGLPSHQGAVILFDAQSGAISAVVDAGAVTAIRTASASALATDVLARADAKRLAILGTGEQAYQHALAIRHVRELEEIRIWGRNAAHATELAQRIESKTGLPTRAASTIADALGHADIICTTTAAADPILFAEDVVAGVHINAVGSSHAASSEIGTDLVKAASFFGDHRASVLAQGAEFIRAREQGLIDDSHFRGEIGEVIDGRCDGRQSPGETTLYKSLGSIVQDLSAAQRVSMLVRARPG